MYDKTYLVILLFQNLQQDSLTVFQTLRREVRFSKFDTEIVNKSMVTVYESTFKQFYDKQMLFFNVSIHQQLSKLYVSICILNIIYVIFEF